MNKIKNVSFRVTTDEYERLKEYSKFHDFTMSETIREAIKEIITNEALDNSEEKF